MSLVTGKIGLEDLALGHGTQVQDLGKGRTRTITEINAGNLPFGANSTFEQAIVNLQDTLKSAEALNITENRDAILLITNELSNLRKIANSMQELSTLASRSYVLDTLVDNLNSITNLSKTLIFTEQAVADSKYREHKMQRTARNLSNALSYISNMCTQEILPMKAQLDGLLVTINSKIATIKAELTDGNELIHKFGSYELKIVAKPNCKQPKIIVDDNRQQIIWQVPTVKGNCTMAKPTQDQIAKAFAEYLVANPDFGGGAGSGLVPLTQDQVNNSIKQGVDNA